MNKLVLTKTKEIDNSEETIKVMSIMTLKEYMTLINNRIINTEESYIFDEELERKYLEKEKKDIEEGIEETPIPIISLFIDKEKEYKLSEEENEIIIEAESIEILDGKTRTNMMFGLSQHYRLDSTLWISLYITTKENANKIISA